MHHTKIAQRLAYLKLALDAMIASGEVDAHDVENCEKRFTHILHEYCHVGEFVAMFYGIRELLPDAEKKHWKLSEE
jgi:hypothetical protein